MNKLILGILLCLSALAIPVASILPFILSLNEDAVTFEAPGEIEVTVEEGDRSYVWHVHRTVHEGRAYSRGRNLPDGVTFSLRAAATGETLPMRTDLSISSSTGQREQSSVGYFDVENPGVYRLAIGGLDEPRIFSFGPSIFSDFPGIFVKIILLGLLAGVLMIAGVVLLILGIVDLVRNGKGRGVQPTTFRSP
jgi:hypothetical protein